MMGAVQTRARQGGAALLETMLAVGISMFLGSLAISYMVRAQSTFATVEEHNYLIENAIYAMDVLAYNIKRAGLMIDGNVNMPVASGDMGGDYLFSATLCGSGGNQACTMDIATQNTSIDTGSASSSRIGVKTQMDIGDQDCTGTSYSARHLVATVFEVDDPDGDNVYSLYCRVYNISTGAWTGSRQPLVDGIDTLHIHYSRINDNGTGVDVTDDYVEAYSNFANLTNSNSERLPGLKSVRLAIVVNSGNNDVASADNLGQPRAFHPFIRHKYSFPAADQRTRRVFSTTVQVMNQPNQ